MPAQRRRASIKPATAPACTWPTGAARPRRTEHPASRRRARPATGRRRPRARAASSRRPEVSRARPRAQVVDPQRVDGIPRKGQGVSGPASGDEPPGRAPRPVGFERAAQLHGVDLQGLARGGRRVAVPQRLGQRVEAHRTGSPGGEDREQQALLGARHGQRDAVVGSDLQRSEDRDAHGRTVGPSGPAGGVPVPPSRGRWSGAVPPGPQVPSCRGFSSLSPWPMSVWARSTAPQGPMTHTGQK